MLKLISSLWLTNSSVGEPLERSWGQVALAEGDSARPSPPNDGNRTGRWCLAVEFVSGGNFLAHGKVETITCSQSAGVVMASAHFFPGKVDNRDVRFSAGAKKVVLLVEDEQSRDVRQQTFSLDYERRPAYTIMFAWWIAASVMLTALAYGRRGA